MPYSYTIDVDRQLVIAVFWGEATIAEADALMAELYADPRHSFSLNRVYDCREMTRLPPITEVRGLAELFRQRVASGVRTRRAMVVRPGATYGLARMFQALLDLVGIELNVFTDVEEAVEWAGAPTPLSR